MCGIVKKERRKGSRARRAKSRKPISAHAPQPTNSPPFAQREDEAMRDLPRVGKKGDEEGDDENVSTDEWIAGTAVCVCRVVYVILTA